MTTDQNNDKTTDTPAAGEASASTDTNSSSSNKAVTSIESPAEKSSPSTESVKTKPSRPSDEPAAAGVNKGLPFWALLLILLVAGCCASIAYLGWHWQQQQVQTTQSLHDQIAKQAQQLASTQQQLTTIEQGSNKSNEQWQQSVGGLEQRIEQHARRLRSMSTTTRDDWLLAEAEYLLRLASQRLQMERGTKGALALLQAADQILVELDDAELFAVRDKLQRDITSLKLAPSIDRSGLYLQLSSWADEIVALPDVPTIQEPAEPASTTPELLASDVAEQSIWQQLKGNFWAAMKQLDNQVRIRHHDQPLEPLLPPDGARYLRQNMRFNLEQAQLAMLREEPKIYLQSLDKCEQSLRQYFSNQDRALKIADEIAKLKNQNIVIELPSINGSLSALQDFIQRLHLLDERAGSPQTVEATSNPNDKAQ